MKEKLAKVKSWAKENWMYVAGGAATVTAVGLAIWKGLKTDNSVIDPMVIDKGKNEWMDQLKTYSSVNGNYLTVRETDAVLGYDILERNLLKEKGILTDNVEMDICDEIKANPDSEYLFSVLDKIEGFWIYVDKDGNKIEGS